MSGKIYGKQVADSPDSSESHAVNVDELSAAVERKLLELPPLSNGCCIYTVLDRMRYSNQRHYTPRIVSISPIHYYDKTLKANKQLKERYLAEFCQQTGGNECYKHILIKERRLRDCYADVINLNSKKFVKMVMLDAAFLIMIFLEISLVELSSRGDMLFGKTHMLDDIFYDLVLLENQLPFFSLKDLYKLSKLQNVLESKFTPEFTEETAMTFLGHQFCKRMSVTITNIPEGRQPCPNLAHILDMLGSSLVPVDWTPERKDCQRRNIPSMKELYQAGLKIQVGSKENIFDIRYKHGILNGILKVPPIVIDDSAEIIFRNLLAFELCRYSTCICSNYFAMMRLLTLSSEDTKLLIQNGVISNLLPNAQGVSTQFQSMDRGNLCNWSEFLYSDVIKGFNEYYESDWHKWKATCYQKYFKAPWVICSLSAVFLFLLRYLTHY